jgi:hypothetical protein
MFAILSEAKDLLSLATMGKQVLRFAQDSKVVWVAARGSISRSLFHNAFQR